MSLRVQASKKQKDVEIETLQRIKSVFSQVPETVHEYDPNEALRRTQKRGGEVGNVLYPRALFFPHSLPHALRICGVS